MKIQLINDRTSLKPGRKVREWTFGFGNEATEKEVLTFRSTYAAAKRQALKIAEVKGHTVVECYKDHGLKYGPIVQVSVQKTKSGKV